MITLMIKYIRYLSTINLRQMSEWKCCYYGILSGLQVVYPLTLEA